MKKEDLLDLVEKISNGTASDREMALYNHWYNSFQADQHWDKAVLGDRNEKEELLFDQINSQIEYRKKGKVRKIWPRVAAAASLLFILSVGTYFIFRDVPLPQIAQNLTYDIAPGGNKAILTLSNGQKIVLTNAKNTKLAIQGNAVINKKNADEITYTATGIKDNGEVTYNTMTTPRGGKFNLILSDGTRVILNAASSIRYPVSFAGKERKVEITGEAYFEVAHNKAKPFLVITKEQTVEVLGTHFNINAYGDEAAIKTTLLEGSIKISKAGKTALIKPGQQAETAISDDIKVFSNVDTDEAIAWTNGLFKFSHADIKAVMRQFSRWYDVDVDYEGKIPNDLISGKIYRNVKASQALEILKYLNIHYRIEKINGINKITITP